MSNYWNTIDKFGCISKWLHWTLAALVGLEFLIIGIKTLLVSLDEKYKSIGGFLIGEIHKPVGILIFMIGIIALIWHALNIRPKLPMDIPLWQKIAARVSHALLFCGVLIMPISGMIMSASAGYPASFFHLTTITLGLHKNPDMAQQFFNIHQIVAILLGILIIIHILAALKHHFINKNNVLTRMLRDPES